MTGGPAGHPAAAIIGPSRNERNTGGEDDGGGTPEGLLLPFVYFDHRGDNIPKKVRPRPWPEVRERLLVHTERQEKDGFGVSFVDYAPGARRSNAGVQAVYAVTFDIDHGEPGWDRLAHEYAAATTHSHLTVTESNLDGGPRWRITLPLAEPVAGAAWGDFWRKAKCHLAPGADEAGKDPARLFYLPAHRPGAPHESRHHPGALLAPAAVPELPAELRPPPRPRPTPAAPDPAGAAAGDRGERPGDAFNRRAEWRLLMTGWGFIWVKESGGEDYWRRAGKTEGQSATTNWLGLDRLKVFSTATPFDTERSYDKFGAYAVMEHQGDFDAATKALAAQGYGAPLPSRPGPYGSEKSEIIPPPNGVSSLNSLLSHPNTAPDPSAKAPTNGAVAWPAPLDTAAFHGLMGEVVRFYAAESEADEAGLLAHFLAAFGVAVGRAPVFRVGATEHHGNEFALIAGRSAKARKGDSWQPIRRLFALALEDAWTRGMVTTGLSSGEGVIHEVRDAAGDPPPGAGRVSDPGVLDKRRVVVESEFGRVFQVMRREGNTLSAVLRDAWDGLPVLKTMTKGSPETATKAHLGIVAHITLPELKRLATSSDAANGFLNRFLTFAVARAKLVPSPRPPDAGAEQALARTLTRTLEAAWSVTAMTRTHAAEVAWERDYAALAAERDGLAGDLLARAEPHVLRLSMLYALADKRDVIDAAHQRAAMAVWRYVEASTVFVYGDATGDEVADTILKALAPGQPLSQTDLHTLFHRSIPAARIRIALDALTAADRVRSYTEPSGERGGRPVTFYVHME